MRLQNGCWGLGPRKSWRTGSSSLSFPSASKHLFSWASMLSTTQRFGLDLFYLLSLFAPSKRTWSGLGWKCFGKWVLVIVSSNLSDSDSESGGLSETSKGHHFTERRRKIPFKEKAIPKKLHGTVLQTARKIPDCFANRRRVSAGSKQVRQTIKIQ